MGTKREGMVHQSRAELAEALGEPFQLPDPGPMGYLLGLWRKAGMTTPFGMGGEMTLAWETIAAFAAATSWRPEPWEAEMLRDISEAFLAGRAEGERTHSRSPDETTTDAVESGLDAALSQAEAAVRIKRERA